MPPASALCTPDPQSSCSFILPTADQECSFFCDEFLDLPKPDEFLDLPRVELDLDEFPAEEAVLVNDYPVEEAKQASCEAPA